MPYLIEIQPDEKLLAEVDFCPSNKAEPFRFAVSDQALFLPAKKFVVAGDPRYFKRVPASQVKEVRVEAVKPYGFYVASVLVILLGLAGYWSFTLPEARLTLRGLAWVAAVLTGGILLPFAGRGRHRLVIQMMDGVFRWVPPLVVDPQSKRQVNAVLDAIVRASATAGLSISDVRAGQT